LLGFTEGDGSFHYSISKEMFTFSLGQKDNEVLMYAIKDFLDSIVIQQSTAFGLCIMLMRSIMHKH
jgi:hypothetical protein